MFDPTGPLPPAVYWRRRGVALGTVLLVLGGTGWGVTALAATPASETAEAPPAAQSPSASRPPTGQQASSATPPSPAPSPAPRPAPEPPKCPDKAVLVRAEVPEKKPRAGKPIEFRITFTNTGDHPCRRDTGAKLRELTVSTPDGEVVWSSDHCFRRTTNEVPLLRPGEPVTNKIVWMGRSSNPKCPLPRKPVPTGEYQLVAKLGSLTSEPVTFRIR